MSSNPRLSARCAIYTRKSSEEGLEMSFNSLDAQREACQAFIASQRQEGWKALPTLYDDGGFSGGSMERPGLKRLLEDVENGQVDTIVVYKVDRLTRSLADFAKIVEALDARGVSFVSVTQQFNTTTSMGRLTLNVLLSFAQFEREVTGERIRDKIAASKRKGMWMGGRAPLGYDVKDRKLVANQQEASLVNELYRRYLELGSVSKLKAYLDQQGIKSKKRVSVTGNHSGGASFFPGALYLILQNPIYLGEVRHRNDVYRGEHEAIIQRDLWDGVQAKLRSANQGRRNGIKANCSSLLVGLIQDTAGNRFDPSHTVKNGKRYRYYVWQATAQGSDRQRKVIRLPAYDIERQVSLRLQSFLQSPNDVMKGLALPGDRPELTHHLILAARKQAAEWSTAPPTAVRDFVRRVVRRVVVDGDKIDVETSRSELRASFTDNRVGTSSRTVLQGQEASPDDLIRLSVEALLKRCGGEMRLVVSPDSPRPQEITPLVKAVVRAHRWREGVLTGEVPDRTVAAKRLDLNEEYLRRVLGCAFLAPDILEAILDGRQPADLTVKTLSRRNLPLDWAKQRAQLGFPPMRVTEPDKSEIPLNRAASPA
jgi:site-specific DNA recombinase